MIPAMFARAPWLLGVLALAGACAGPRDVRDGGDAPFAPYDARVDLGAPADAEDAREDVAPTVDVIPFDGGPAPFDAALDAAAETGDAETCRALAESYAQQVQEAQACMAAGDCGAVVCETLCCNCEVYVNARSAAFPMLERLRTRWQAAGCVAMTACPLSMCEPPSSAECSSRGRCTTLRRTSGG
jgi:hypothetical protein